jgi:hypothetical protein
VTANVEKKIKRDCSQIIIKKIKREKERKI